MTTTTTTTSMMTKITRYYVFYKYCFEYLYSPLVLTSLVDVIKPCFFFFNFKVRTFHALRYRRTVGGNTSAGVLTTRMQSATTMPIENLVQAIRQALSARLLSKQVVV
jgi:hypothetical protein